MWMGDGSDGWAGLLLPFYTKSLGYFLTLKPLWNGAWLFGVL